MKSYYQIVKWHGPLDKLQQKVGWEVPVRITISS